jgi:F-box-like
MGALTSKARRPALVPHKANATSMTLGPSSGTTSAASRTLKSPDPNPQFKEPSLQVSLAVDIRHIDFRDANSAMEVDNHNNESAIVSESRQNGLQLNADDGMSRAALDAIWIVLSHLSIADLGNLQRVSRVWYEILRDNGVWLDVARRLVSEGAGGSAGMLTYSVYSAASSGDKVQTPSQSLAITGALPVMLADYDKRIAAAREAQIQRGLERIRQAQLLGLDQHDLDHRRTGTHDADGVSDDDSQLGHVESPKWKRVVRDAWRPRKCDKCRLLFREVFASQGCNVHSGIRDIVHSGYGPSGVRWTCCGQQPRDAPGCGSGMHSPAPILPLGSESTPVQPLRTMDFRARCCGSSDEQDAIDAWVVHAACSSLL